MLLVVVILLWCCAFVDRLVVFTRLDRLAVNWCVVLCEVFEYLLHFFVSVAHHFNLHCFQDKRLALVVLAFVQHLTLLLILIIILFRGLLFRRLR